MPRTLEAAQALLLRYGLDQLKVTDIAEDRLFCVTTFSQLYLKTHGEDAGSDVFGPRARTVVLVPDGNSVRAVELHGWVIGGDDESWDRVKP